MQVKNITWARASCSGDALIDAACCTHGWICFCAQGMAEHPHSSTGCCMETKQLTPANGQGCDAVSDTALPGFPSHTTCKSCFCDETRRNDGSSKGPGARVVAVGLREAQSPGCGSGRILAPPKARLSPGSAPRLPGLLLAHKHGDMLCQPCSQWDTSLKGKEG